MFSQVFSLVLSPVISQSSSLVLSPVLTLLLSSHSMVTSGAKNLKHLYSPPKLMQWSLSMLASRTPLSFTGHQISFGFAIFPFHDNIKHIKHCSVQLAINKLALSLQYSHSMNTSSIKHHCVIPISIKKLTFHLHRSIDRWWEPRVSPPRCLLQSFPPHPQWCPL